MKRVVLVEDSRFLREVARDLLKERGLAERIDDCEDGVAFIEQYARAVFGGDKPDLVVLDVRMPMVDGREVAYAMRAIETGTGVKRTPILFFSAVLCDDAFKATLRSLGAARYIRKPDGTDVSELGERVVSVLERLVGQQAAS